LIHHGTKSGGALEHRGREGIGEEIGDLEKGKRREVFSISAIFPIP
jgi:hypothetical protein